VKKAENHWRTAGAGSTVAEPQFHWRTPVREILIFRGVIFRQWRFSLADHWRTLVKTRFLPPLPAA
jgi:hypothetical protein